MTGKRVEGIGRRGGQIRADAQRVVQVVKDPAETAVAFGVIFRGDGLPGQHIAAQGLGISVGDVDIGTHPVDEALHVHFGEQFRVILRVREVGLTQKIAEIPVILEGFVIAVLHITGIFDEQGIVLLHIIVSSQVFCGIFLHQVIHPPVFPVEKDLTGEIALGGGISVSHQVKEERLFQRAAAAENQVGVRNVSVKKHRIEGGFAILFSGK